MTSNLTAVEWVGLSFFPIGVIIGFAVAWWREALGAAIAASSLLMFYMVYGALLSGRVPGGPWFFILTSPAALFFVSWLCGKKGGGKMNAMAARA